MAPISTAKKVIYSVSGALTMLGTKAFAQSPQDTINDAVNNINPGANTDLGALITLIINMMIAAIGIAAVIMLIVGGFKYVFSQGNKETTASAKDTILYAIIGIVVAVLAFAIVNFVLTGLG